MSDERLRELERRWKETGAVEDEAAYLLERVRVGQLTQERLELAAYCGHEAACWATAISPPDVGTKAALEAWCKGLERWGQPLAARACLALASQALPAWQRGFPHDERLAAAMSRVREQVALAQGEGTGDFAEELNWVDDAIDEARHLPADQESITPLEELFVAEDAWRLEMKRPRAAAAVVRATLLAGSGAINRNTPLHAAESYRSRRAARAAGRAALAACTALNASPASVARVIRDDLVPWCLWW